MLHNETISGPKIPFPPPHDTFTFPSESLYAHPQKVPVAYLPSLFKYTVTKSKYSKSLPQPVH
jgi:hypothetical protein